MTAMKIHPFADLFPMMPEADLKAMGEDIKINGQRLPIISWNDMIIDGRNRLKACELVGVEPVIKDKSDVFNNELEVIEFINSANLLRRHLSASERAVIAVELVKAMKKENEQKQEEDSVTETTMIEEAAEQAHVSPAYVKMAEKVAEESPEKYEEVKKGKKTVSKAVKEIDLEKDAEKDDNADVNDTEKDIVQIAKEEKKLEDKANKMVAKLQEKLEEFGYSLVSTKIERIS